MINFCVWLTICSYDVMYAFQSESTCYSCLNVNELLAWSRCEIWSSSDCNWTRTHNHLVHKWTLNHLAKLTKRLSCVVSTYLYGAFDCMFLSCHMYMFQSESTIYSCLNVKELFAQRRHEIWSLSTATGQMVECSFTN